MVFLNGCPAGDAEPETGSGSFGENQEGKTGAVQGGPRRQLTAEGFNPIRDTRRGGNLTGNGRGSIVLATAEAEEKREILSIVIHLHYPYYLFL